MEKMDDMDLMDVHCVHRVHTVHLVEVAPLDKPPGSMHCCLPIPGARKAGHEVFE